MTKTAYSRNTAFLLGLVVAASIAGANAEPQAADKAKKTPAGDKNVAQIDVEAGAGPVRAKAGVDLGFERRHRSILEDLFTDQDQVIIPQNMRTMIRANAEADTAPGIRTDLTPGRALPTGITRQIVYLPADVNARLGWDLEPQYRVGVYRNDIFLYDSANNRVIDVMNDVFKAEDVEIELDPE